MVLDQIFNDVDQKEASFQKSKITMDEYLESLKKEQQQWKDVLLSRKKLCKQSKEKNEFDPLVIKEGSAMSYLNEEERSFLESKPDYLNMLSNVKKYADACSYINRYKMDIIKRYEGTREVMELQRQMVVEKMSADDLCELCNMKNCNDADHQFLFK